MSKIGDFFAWLFISLLLLWFAGLVFALDPCTRVYRSAWPVVYPIKAFEVVSANWTNDQTKLDVLLWKAKSAIFMQEVFEKTVYGDTVKCKK